MTAGGKEVQWRDGEPVYRTKLPDRAVLPARLYSSLTQRDPDMRRRRRTGRDAYRRPGLLCRVCGKSHFLTSSSLKEHIAAEHVRGSVKGSARGFKRKGRKARAKALRREYNRAEWRRKKSRRGTSSTSRKSKSSRGWRKPSRKDVREYNKRSGFKLPKSRTRPKKSGRSRRIDILEAGGIAERYIGKGSVTEEASRAGDGFAVLVSSRKGDYVVRVSSTGKVVHSHKR